MPKPLSQILLQTMVPMVDDNVGPDNGSTFSRKPREHTTANLNCPYARIGGCNVVLGG
jgi:hypothetical protein